MITIKSASELVKMQAAGKVVGETLKLLGENIRPASPRPTWTNWPMSM